MVNADPTAGSIRLLITARSFNREGPEIVILNRPAGITTLASTHAIEGSSLDNLNLRPVSIAPSVANAVAPSLFPTQEIGTHLSHGVIQGNGGSVATPSGPTVTISPASPVGTPAVFQNTGTHVDRDSGNIVVSDKDAAECFSRLLNASGCGGRVQYSTSDDYSASVPLRIIKKPCRNPSAPRLGTKNQGNKLRPE